MRFLRLSLAAKQVPAGPPWIGHWRAGCRAGDGARRKRRAEDGTIDKRYPLKESLRTSYSEPNEWNVLDSDASTLLSIAPTLSGGSLDTVEFARRHKKPWLHVHSQRVAAVEMFKTFLDEKRVKVLNLTGQNGREEPEIAQFVVEILDKVFGFTSEKPRPKNLSSRRTGSFKTRASLSSSQHGITRSRS